VRYLRPRLSFIYIYLTTFVVFVCWSAIRPYVPLFATSEVGATLVEAGVIASAGGLGGAIIAAPTGLLTDRFGRKQFIILGAMVLGVSSVLLSGTSTVFQTMLAFAATGIGAGMMDASLSASIADLVLPGHLGRAYGVFTTALQSAFSMGPAVGGLLVFLFDFRSAFLVLAAFLFFGMCLASFIPKSSQPMPERNRGLTFNDLRDAHLRLGWTLTITTSLLTGSSVAYFPLYLRDIGFDTITIGLLFAALSISAAISRVPLGTLIDKHRAEKATAFAGIMIASASVAFFPFVQAPLGLAGLMLLQGPSVGAISLVASVTVAKYAQPANRGLMMGMNSTFRNIGLFLGPVMVASVMSLSEGGLGAYRLGFVIMSVTVALVTSMALAVVRFGDSTK
jgi:MFS family permease